LRLSDEEGRAAVVLARETLDSFVGGRNPKLRSWDTGFLSEIRGVFVTLNTIDAGPEKLRGCIGFPYPVKKLGEAIQEATVMAASEDPRFPPVGVRELRSIVVEVSVLTPPTAVHAARRQDIPKQVRIGEDGLIMSRAHFSGLLLPQVATEFGLGPAEFLSEACMKAGLPPDAWLDKETEVQVFQAEIFAERSPEGTVERVKI
jgi:uncharacterized protein (TIGR00296 family)